MEYLLYIIGGIIIIFLICIVVHISQNNHIPIPTPTPISTLTPTPISPQEESFCDLSDNYQIYNSPQLIIKRPKILIISCYGYGNMGDNMYSEVFEKYLNDCEIVKVSDHSIFVNHLKNLSLEPPSDDYNFDYLIIGGGGLITSTKLKDSHNIPYYISLAKKNAKKLFIVSCGVQGDIRNFRRDFLKWKDPLEYATLVTVRSKKDKELLSSIAPLGNIKYFRDLGYIYPHLVEKHKKANKITTLIIAGPVDDKHSTIRNHIKKTKKDVVIMNMGSLKDDDNNNRMIKMSFPGVKVKKYYGSGKASEFSKYAKREVNQSEMESILRSNPKLEEINPSDLDLHKVIDTIYNSDIVYTGRYHGFVFARTLGIPYDTLGMDTNKIQWEESFRSIKDAVINSYNNIQLLRKYMGLQDRTGADLVDLENNIITL